MAVDGRLVVADLIGAARDRAVQTVHPGQTPSGSSRDAACPQSPGVQSICDTMEVPLDRAAPEDNIHSRRTISLVAQTIAEHIRSVPRAQPISSPAKKGPRMFGSRHKATEARLAAAETVIERLVEETAAARQLIADTRHLERLSERAERLRDAAETALKGVQGAAIAAGVHRPRFKAERNKVYQAEATGYVSLYFQGGFTDRIEILVGPEDPPQECVCMVNTRNEINSYAGAIVRVGEYWVARSERSGRSGFVCVFTPLF
jgi:hypothetical protein